MANDKYDAFPQPIIILLLDLFLVCRWQQRATEGTERGGGQEGGQEEKMREDTG